MPASFWERDAAYRRRIVVIVPVVLAGYLLLFLATDRIRYEDIPRFIGWKGELEVLPEITVVPTVGSIETEPAPREKSVRETVALDLWRKGDVPTEPKPAPAPATEAQPVVDPGQGNAQFRSMDRPGERETAYTEDFALIKAVEPVYPPLERSEGIEGTVTVEMLVDEYGMVVEANVLSIMGPDSFAESALHAVRQFVFDPPKENGQPKRIWVRLRIKFRISG